MNNNKINDQKSVVCSNCGYNTNPATATHCLKCGKPLDYMLLQSSNKGKRFTPWMIWLSFGLLFVIVSYSMYSLFGTGDTLNDSSIIGNSNSSPQNIPSDITLYNSIKEVPNVPGGTFNYGGATLFASLNTHGLNDAIMKAHPNFHLRYTEPRDNKPGGRKGIAMLLNGELSFAQIAAPLDEQDYVKAERRNFKLKQVPVALDMLVLFTHPEIRITGLSLDQIEDIYTGKVTNWKQVGGADLAIVPFTIDPSASNLLSDLIGKKAAAQISPKVQLVRDYTEAIRKVVSTPGGISFGGNAPLIGQQSIRPLAIAKANSQNYVQPFINGNQQSNTAAIKNGSYPVTRRLFIVFRQDGTIDELAGHAYSKMLLTQEGQQIVEKAGLVPLR
ncbi:substrate-binding domain-containing protein [Aetokthonos hydrillicola Thurmond2011]|jgi:phosphate transport system substrate-binding protein|uniref:Substrate-binding domain-containing protein n=1 Tax=Aetokthonos hydrillicola Thurmond2011 TaxID=2712845 RepID=A0AAP5M7I3_9CYAN|nr:substrate-binding domain-containing protein [Aetokthonos hydrillicola]MBO3461606.1 hypothetical protein [Aetokthonos hydrillicola CCALA 1050]MBW4589305.1 substrate-binding domain-containing protein [Aetokthonos hydrillicola CCALA 1050]MDR9898161.1 substrate-binding domain-containing protein [Aetokthonos hydrillicola Thurmond2011]